MSKFDEYPIPRIEITRITPLWVTIEGASGKRIVFSEIGEPAFYITVFEDEGDTILWNGKSYEEAIIAAEESARDWDAVVCDCVVE